MTEEIVYDLKDISISEQRNGNDLVFPNFEDINPYTNTFVIKTNLNINTTKVYEILPITPYTIVPKKRGRKKKIDVPVVNENIPSGSIISVEHRASFRGVNVQQKDFSEKKFFRNSITIVMVLENDKKINFKISKNGKFQMTGCRNEDQAFECVRNIWNLIKDDPSTFSVKPGTDAFEFLIVPVMRNIDFKVNFTIDRLKIDSYINTRTPYTSLLETSSGYTGVNASFPIRKNILETPIHKYIFPLETPQDNKFIKVQVPYSEYFGSLKPTEKKKKEKMLAKKVNTFLIFQSGCIICSGINADIVRDSYNEFVNLIKECYSEVVEVLDKKKK
jgi:TATA-box binding protein (TBP) (component of TFIID and TFIIIB)